MNNLKDQLLFIRKGMEVQRFHSLLTVQIETVGHHSCGVAWMAWCLTGGVCSAALLMSALAHDLPEQHTGDIPSPTKKRMNLESAFHLIDEKYLRDIGMEFHLSDAEKRILKMADVLDGALFCVRERSLGNAEIKSVYNKFIQYLKTHNPVYREAEVFFAVQQLWDEVDK